MQQLLTTKIATDRLLKNEAGTQLVTSKLNNIIKDKD